MRRKAYKYKKRKPRRGAAKTTEAKVRSLQSSWRQATNRTESLSKEEAQSIVDNPPVCIYCSKTPHWKEISVDHIQPRSRDGLYERSNLAIVCRTCNLQKGNLTGDEYKALLAFLSDWPIMQESVFLRLRAGGAALRRRRRS
jgi:5-methylcytosine-specific restriction endonuclease McrA